MRHRLTAEHGNALVTALVLTMIMLSVGLAGLAQVDVQQEQSGVERVRETTFNLGEGVLNAQIFAVSRRWPGPGAGTAPASALLGYGVCTEASDPLTSPNCPDPQTIKGLFTSPDTADATAWRTEVRDNDTGGTPLTCSPKSGSRFYSDASTAGQPAFDCNADGKLWVRAQATIRGRTRAMVALVQAESINHQLPRAALLAGRLEIGNMGNKVLVDAQAGTALNAEILLRCKGSELLYIGGVETPCVGQGGLLDDLWSATRSVLRTQLNGTKPVTGYSEEPALSEDALARLKQTAITSGTYFATCPEDPSALAGALVYVETCNRSYKSNVVINSAAEPGALIIANGYFELLGNTTYHGLVYHANLNNSTEKLVKLTGNNGVSGAVFVENQGGFEIQGSAYLTINENAFEPLRSYGSAGIIQNTWREIPSGVPVSGQTW